MRQYIWKCLYSAVPIRCSLSVDSPTESYTDESIPEAYAMCKKGVQDIVNYFVSPARFLQ